MRTAVIVLIVSVQLPLLTGESLAGSQPSIADLRLFELKTPLSVIERAHPQCRKHRERSKRGLRCSVYLIQTDKNGVESSAGWCADGSSCSPRWEYDFDHKNRLRRVRLIISSVDVDETLFKARWALMKRLSVLLRTRYGKPLSRRDFRRGYRSLDTARRNASVRYRRARWRLDDKSHLTLTHRAVASHHAVVNTILVVK